MQRRTAASSWTPPRGCRAARGTAMHVGLSTPRKDPAPCGCAWVWEMVFLVAVPNRRLE